MADPDGLLTRADPFADLSALPPPLCRLRREAVVDFKMPGDHTDRGPTFAATCAG